MAFSDARNAMPDGIAVSTPRIGRGPNTTAAQAVQAFGTLGGQAYEGKVTGQLNNALQEGGNMIAALNSPLVERRVNPQGDKVLGVDIHKADLTGTVDITSERFKKLEQSRLQGLITQQRATLEADTILREAITKAPGFATQLRASAAAELGFNPSGAALELLYLSGPDANKTVKQTQQDKDLEQSDSFVAAGLYPTREEAFRHIQEAKVAEQSSKILSQQIQQGTVSAPQIVNAAVTSFSSTANGLIMGMTAQLAATGGVQDPAKWAASLQIEANKSKEKYRQDMQNSNVPYQQTAYDAMDKAIDAQVKTYTDIANNNDLVKVIKDRRDSVVAVAQMAGINAAPDLYAINFAGGRSAVDAYLNMMQLIHGNPKAAKELAASNPKYAYLAGVINDMPAASKAIREALAGNIAEAVKTGTVNSKDAEVVVRGLADQCIDSQDPVTCARIAASAAALDMPNAMLGTLAHVRGSFVTASEDTKLKAQRATLANLEDSKRSIAQGIAGTNANLVYDQSKGKFTLTDATRSVPDAQTQRYQAAAGGADLYATPIMTNPSIPSEVKDALEVLNEQIHPLLQQPEWGTFVFASKEWVPDQFINDTVNETNLRAQQTRLFGNGQDIPASTQQMTVATQAAIARGIATAQSTGDRSALDEALSQAGIAPVPASAVKGTGNKIEKLDAGTYRDTETGSMFMVDEKGNHVPLNDPQSGKIQRGPQFGDLGLGTFQLPDNLSTSAAQHISTIQSTWAAKGLDPNVGLAIAMTESSLNPSAKAKGSSATGLFQFTKDTAKDFGLADRKDAEDSANAAADLFKVLLDRTNGDVIKAIALYHGGRNKGEPDQADLDYADQVIGHLQTTSADSNVTDLKASFF